jgi:hypothetical protein
VRLPAGQIIADIPGMAGSRRHNVGITSLKTLSGIPLAAATTSRRRRRQPRAVHVRAMPAEMLAHGHYHTLAPART